MNQLFIVVVVVLYIGSIECNPVAPTPRARRSQLLRSRENMEVSKRNQTIMKAKIFSKSQMFLQIDKNGIVSGANQCSLTTVSMKLMSTGRAGVKMIRGVSSGRYLAMNRDGEVYSTEEPGDETTFLEKLGTNGYSTFTSFKYYRREFDDTFLAVNSNGTMRRGTDTNRWQNEAQFFVLREGILNC